MDDLSVAALSALNRGYCCGSRENKQYITFIDNQGNISRAVDPHKKDNKKRDQKEKKSQNQKITELQCFILFLNSWIKSYFALI